MNIRLIVPNNDSNVGQGIAQSPKKYWTGERENRHGLPIDRYGKAITDIAGGFTATQGTGGWIGPDGVLVVEPVTVFDCSIDADNTAWNGRYENLSDQFRRLAKRIARELRQDCIYLAIDGVVEYVKP